MAQIKISELSELETKQSNDIIPIVDVSEGETKKIKVDNLVSKNKPLIAVTDEEPTEFSEGDEYYNTDERLIYTALNSTTWSVEGKVPEEGIMYVVFPEKSTFAWDGSDLISVGGGSGETITQQSTAPENPEENDLWIDTTNGNALKRYNGTSWELVSTSSDAPIGTITPFAGATPPSDYLLCDGSAVSRTTYADLFSVIGTTYGVGNGSTTFNLPNIKGRTLVGLDTSQTEFNTLGKTSGEKTHTLTVQEIPPHSHTWAGGTAGDANTNDVIARSPSPNYYNFTNGINETGGGQAHNNIQPSFAIYYIIKAKKVTPAQSSVVNTQSNSTTDTYSCNEANTLFQEKGTILYNNATGTSGNVTLSDSVNDYEYIEIYFTSSGYAGSKKIDLSTSTSFMINLPFIYNTAYYDRMSKYSISGNTITYNESIAINSNFSSVTTGANEILIKKVIGYKEV